ncbi:Uncharacterized protein TPAR_00511 [Tolypocladium paradoxum]|uniref:Bicarbonate transporter-like transmembrane domain-containing protein n=1 Tax=Tolypocladium paradoxum TaxID=94208 RepID=A0A2S4LA21_9HYPO|nr:Uncharacterized protein TPAR_00511 [Tolypocladium paradoxum]
MTAPAGAARRPARHGAASNDDHGPQDARGQEAAAGELPGRPEPSRYFGPAGTLRPFRLLRGDVANLRRRWPSDWAVFNQQVVASAVYIFFTNILPGITFANDLYVLTGKSWGTIEVVFSTGLCGVIFAVFSAQPLTILGVTGPFSVLAENIHKLCETHFHVEFLPVMAWSLIHAGWMHVLLAVFNAHDWTMKYVTHFSADVFSLLNSVIYFHKAALELQRTHDRASLAALLYAVIGASGTCLLAVLLSTANSWTPLFHRYVRLGLAEYAAAISIILWIGIPHIGELAALDHERLQVQTAFQPSSPERATFFVRFWTLPVGWVFLSIIPGAIITVLFYFDHEISSIICTVQRYGVRKPGGFAWDIVLLGATTVLCGILGIPPANGLLPQAPLHAESLLYYVAEGPPRTDETGEGANDQPDPEPERARPVARTYEQRYSPLFQAALILVFVSPPLQRLLGLAQTSVLAGLFLFMGYQSLAVNPILARIVHLLTPWPELPALPGGASWLGVHCYTITQVVLTGVVFGITLTVAAPAFPLVIIALVPLRLSLMGRMWSRETLRAVDGWACRPGRPEDGEHEAQPQQTPRMMSDEEKGDVASDAVGPLAAPRAPCHPLCKPPYRNRSKYLLKLTNMALELAGKSALITGGGAGINLAFAKLLLEKGCSVTIGDLRLSPEAEALFKQYPHHDGDRDTCSAPSAVFHKTNVVSWPQLSALWAAATSTFPTVDIVVPGAGIFEPAWSSFWSAPKTDANPGSQSRDPADADPGHYATLDINLVAPIRLSQLAIGHWTQRRQKGCLVLVGSIAGYMASPTTPLYFVSKHGLHGFVRSLGGLRDAAGIRIGAVAPGAVKTALWEEDPTKASMITPDIDWIEHADVAAAMYQLVVDEDKGDGTILEILSTGTRVVPLFNADPPETIPVMLPGYHAAQQALLEHLKTDGLQV